MIERWLLRIVAGLVALALAAGAGYWKGGENARATCEANAAKADRKTEGAEDQRDAAIETIGQDTRDKAASTHADTMGNAYASADRVRTVYVAGPCRDVPAGVLSEHAAAVQRINAKVGGGMRPGAAVGPADTPGD